MFPVLLTFLESSHSALNGEDCVPSRTWVELDSHYFGYWQTLEGILISKVGSYKAIQLTIASLFPLLFLSCTVLCVFDAKLGF